MTFIMITISIINRNQKGNLLYAELLYKGDNKYINKVKNDSQGTSTTVSVFSFITIIKKREKRH